MPSLPLTILLFLLHSFLAQAKTQQAATIKVGSLITAGLGIAWTSPSSRFAFGFYAVETKFAIGIWFVTNNTIIWTADRDGDLHPEGTRLKLSDDGLQIPSPTGDRTICNITTNEAKLASASMEDSGNFVILNVNNHIIWQTFDFPTDTLMAGQLLRGGNKLVSSISATNHSSGRFQVVMQLDGNVVFYPVNTPDNSAHAYLATGTNGDGYTNARLTSDGLFFLIRDVNATHNYTLFSSYSNFGRIDPDGIFRAYFTDSIFTKLVNELPETGDMCSIKGACGSNSYCNSIASSKNSSGLDQGKVECLCLPGFNYTDQTKPYMGCQRNFFMGQCVTDIKNNITYSITKLANVSWIDDSYSYTELGTAEDCSDSCHQDCNCYAALFWNHRCSKQRHPFLYGTRSADDPTIAFLKVGSGEPKRLPPPLPEEVIENIPSTKTLLMSVALASALILPFSAAFFFLYINLNYRKKWKNMKTGLAGGIAPQSFTYRQLAEATKKFSICLGQGGFSTVFKGEISLGNNKSMPIAVKRLKKLSAVNEKSFRTEMRAVGGAHHRNLVRLLGFCHEATKWFLIYEYMSQGTLADLIFPPREARETQAPQAAQQPHLAALEVLEAHEVQVPQVAKVDKARPCWKERTCIAMDVARGILYLHEGCGSPIIHGDIKPENVLVSEDGTAKIGDLGLAKLLSPWQSKTYTRATGTGFYIAPEWAQGADAVNPGVDVYSFGVLLLELITCRKYFESEAVDDRDFLSQWAYKCLIESTLEQLVPDGEEVDKDELRKIVMVALWCLQKPPHRKSMKEVFRMLGGKTSIADPPNHIFYHEGDKEPKIHEGSGPDAGRDDDSKQQKAPDNWKSMKEVVLMLKEKIRSSSSR